MDFGATRMNCGIIDAGVSCFLKTVRPSNCDDTALAKAAKQEI
ncbi:hypothetical protein RLEG12_31350 [Rhizobium leguminosarum bv. trifolii CB782]|nr:hypothetical protein RLEG12_31350 [Rhizobium leguminosarum bv. trifolii CB782]